MHRLLVEPASLALDAVTLSREAGRHLCVLRPKPGEAIELFDGCGATREYRCPATNGAPLVASAPLCRHPRREPGLTLFACVTKGSRWDWTIEKATELGVSRIVPVISARTIVRISADEREAKAERWRRVAADAARQSDACWLPEIVAPVDFAASLDLVRSCDCLVGALVQPPAPPILDVVRELGRGARPRAVYVGPEGDFTPDELAALIALARPVSFGPTILRAETAAIFAVSVLAAEEASRG